MSCKLKIRNEQSGDVMLDVAPATKAEELKKMVVDQLAESGGEVGKQVSATNQIRLFYMGKELSSKGGDSKLEDYKITPRDDQYIVQMNINIGQSAPGPSEKTSNCPCSIQ